MSICTDYLESLSGFEKRMKFINIVRCLLEYKYPDNIRAMVPRKRVLDNIIVAVLVFIKDSSLGDEQKCTLTSIEEFLERFSCLFPEDCNINCNTLAKYIVVDVLQNGGEWTEYLTFYSDTETFENMPIRLINEERGTYHLTDDAFDFLFRCKEIESELDYSITRFRLKESLKRNNYESALADSKELVSRIRNMKVSMDDFLLRCREDISKITIDQYDSVILRIRSLLESEYQELADIQETAKERQEQLLKAQLNGVVNEETKKYRLILSEIIQNIALTIDEQRSLINKKTSLSESYDLLLRDSLTIARFERLNFDKDIMAPLRRTDGILQDAAKFLLFPLTCPEMNKMFSVENFYGLQSKLGEDVVEEGIDMTSEESNASKEIQVRNQRFKSICIAFFRFLDGREFFRFSEFVTSLSFDELYDFCYENALPNFILTMYAEQVIDIEAWKQSEKFNIVPMGELELSWCLGEISPEYLQIRKIRFTCSDNSFSFSVSKDGKQRNIDMTDFLIEVLR